MLLLFGITFAACSDYCNSCTSCDSAVDNNNAYVCLSADIISTDDAPCVTIKGKNVVFDGNGYAIKNTKFNSAPAIVIDNNNVNVRNFVIEGYAYGIRIKDNDYATVENNTINATGVGIEIQGGSNNCTIRNNIVVGSPEYGIWIDKAAKNNVIIYNIFNSTSSYLAYVKPGGPCDNVFSMNVNGTWQGNYWVGIELLNITDANGDGFGDSGSQYPYNATNGGNVSACVVDYGPIIFNITMVDNPPTAGTVWDGTNDPNNEVDYTNNPNSYYASWGVQNGIGYDFSDDNGIAYYEVSIGTTPGDDDVYSWTNVGNVEEYTITGLSLSDGTYYFNVKGCDSLGQCAVNSSDGLTVDTTLPSVALEPSNGTVTKSQNVEFKCYADDLVGLKEIRFYVWTEYGLVFDDAVSVSGTNAAHAWNLTLPFGTYNWTCDVVDVADNKLTGPEYTLSIVSAECGDIITENTTLAEDLTCSGTALTVGADDVVLDCNGHTIIGDGTGYGVFVDNVDNVKVVNCTIINFTTGIYFESSDNSLAKYNRITSAALEGNLQGILVDSSTNVSVVENDIYLLSKGEMRSDNAAIILKMAADSLVSLNNITTTNFSGIGIKLINCEGNIVEQNDITTLLQWGFLIWLNESHENEIRDNTGTTHAFSAYGIYSENSTFNRYYGNTISSSGNSNYGLYVYGGGSNEYWDNVVETSGNESLLIRVSATRNNTFKDIRGTASGGGADGILIDQNSSSNLFENVEVSAAGESAGGVKFDGASNETFYNCAIITTKQNSPTIWFSLYPKGLININNNNLFENCTFSGPNQTYFEKDIIAGNNIYRNINGLDRYSIWFAEAKAENNVTIQWFVRVNVTETVSGGPVDGAAVSAEDANGGITDMGTTNALGLTDYFAMNDTLYRGAGDNITYNPVQFTAVKGVSYGVALENINENKNVTIFIIIDDTPPSPPGKPYYAGLMVNGYAPVRNLSFCWSASVENETGIDGYEFILSNETEPLNPLISKFIGDETCYVLSAEDEGNITDGQTYYVWVRANNTYGQWSDMSEGSDGVVVDIMPPSPIDDLNLTSSASILLTWTLPVDNTSGLDYQTTYRRVCGVGTYEAIANVSSTETTYKDEDATHGIIWQYKVVGTDFAGNTQSDGNEPCLLANLQPLVSTVEIMPPNATTLDNLTCNGVFTDPDEDSEGNSTYRWFINGTEVIGVNSATLPANMTNAGDVVVCEYTPVDEYGGVGEPVNSTTIVVGSAPSGGGGGGGGGDETPDEIPLDCGRNGVCVAACGSVDPDCPQPPPSLNCNEDGVCVAACGETDPDCIQKPPTQQGTTSNATTATTYGSELYMLIAPSGAYLGDNVTIILRDSNSQPVQGREIRVIGPTGAVMSVITNENGSARYPANAVGVYTYETPGISLVDKPTTTVYPRPQTPVVRTLQRSTGTQPPSPGIVGMFLGFAGSREFQLLSLLLLLLLVLAIYAISRRLRKGR
ncbi:MAG: right-handed parallel beta-helix repeat-containing protein [Candidatus Micrarchaeia archaeon]